jgi:hypothetical protein
MSLLFPRLILVIQFGTINTTPKSLSVFILQSTFDVLIDVPEFVQKCSGVMFSGHKVVHLDLKFTRSIMTICSPNPTINTFTIQSTMMHIDVNLMTWKMFIHEPSYNSLATFLGVIVTRMTKRKHNEKELQ